MAAPTYRGKGTYSLGGTTSQVIDIDAITGHSAGDLLLLVCESSDSTTAAGTPNTPAEWTKIFEASSGAGATGVTTLTIFAKIHDGSEADVTVDGVGNHISGTMFAITAGTHGVTNVATDIVVGAASDHGTTQAGCSTSGITVTADSLILLCVALSDDAANDTSNVSNQTNANLASITKREDNTTSTGAGGGVSVTTATCAGTSTGATTWDHDTAANAVSVHLGIPPVAAGPTAYSLDCQPGAFVITGIAATVARGLVVNAAPTSYALTGAAASPVAGRMVNAVPGAYALTGVATGLLATRLVSVDPGTYAITGAAAQVGREVSLEASPGSLVISGAAAGLPATRIIGASPGAFAITGDAATLIAARSIGADPGSFTVSGAVANLVYGSLVAAYILDAEIGSYSVAGADAEFVKTTVYALSADPASYALTGEQAGFAVGRSLGAEPGSYVLTGSLATFQAGTFAAPPRTTRTRSALRSGQTGRSGGLGRTSTSGSSGSSDTLLGGD